MSRDSLQVILTVLLSAAFLGCATSKGIPLSKRGSVPIEVDSDYQRELKVEFDRIDQDENGMISLEEVKAASKRDFHLLDRDYNGVLSDAELGFKNILDPNKDDKISEEEFQSFRVREFKRADESKDQQLTFQEVKSHLKIREY